MKASDLDNLDIHPAIKAREPDSEPITEFHGFVGTASTEMLRLYVDLSMISYVDIPKKAVVHVEEDISGEAGRIRAFVYSDQSVQEGSRRTVTAKQSTFAATALHLDARFPKAVVGGLSGCYERCEEVFKQNAANIARLELMAETICREGTPSQCGQAHAAVYEATAEAVDALFQCIRRCREVDPYFVSSIHPPVAEIVDNICRKYLGRGCDG